MPRKNVILLFFGKDDVDNYAHNFLNYRHEESHYFYINWHNLTPELLS